MKHSKKNYISVFCIVFALIILIVCFLTSHRRSSVHVNVNNTLHVKVLASASSDAYKHLNVIQISRVNHSQRFVKIDGDQLTADGDRQDRKTLLVKEVIFYNAFRLRSLDDKR